MADLTLDEAVEVVRHTDIPDWAAERVIAALTASAPAGTPDKLREWDAVRRVGVRGRNNCPDCNGRGWYASGDMHSEPEQTPCARCEGSGRAAPPAVEAKEIPDL